MRYVIYRLTFIIYGRNATDNDYLVLDKTNTNTDTDQLILAQIITIMILIINF